MLDVVTGSTESYSNSAAHRVKQALAAAAAECSQGRVCSSSGVRDVAAIRSCLARDAINAIKGATALWPAAPL